MFLKRHSIFILFVVLEGLAIGYFINSNSYVRARAHMAAARVTGGTNKMFTSAGDYFTLRKDNDMLRQRLAELENELAGHGATAAEGADVAERADGAYAAGGANGANRAQGTAGADGWAGNGAAVDSAAGGVTAFTARPGDGAFFYSPARVISNSTVRQHNFFVIDRGWGGGVEENMAVISAGGYVAGYVQSISENFSVCMSILNRDFRIGGKIKGKDYFGSIYWDGVSPRFVTLSDVPRYAPVEVGDTILSSYSLRFPQDSRIGVVHSFREAGDGAYFEIKVKLGMDMEKLSDVLLIKYRDSTELSRLAGELFPDNK